MALKVDPLEARFDEILAHLANAPDAEVLQAAMKSPAIHFALFCRIKDDDNVVIDPRPNILQLRMNEAYETLKNLGIRVRIIVTKPRRAGCSSFVEHIGYHNAMVSPIEGITISDCKEHSADALKKLQDYAIYDSYPWNVREVKDSAHSVAWSNGSRWTVDTAQNPDAGAGGTYQFAHCSETSKWPQTQTMNDVKTMTCLTPSVSGLNTVMFSESTPEGARGWQYKTWTEKAITLDEFLERWANGFRPEEVWIKVFAAWFEFASNRRQKPCTQQEIAHIQATLDRREIEEIEKYALDWEQVAWRRDTITNKCNGDPKIFAYYYPSDDKTCWLASGSPRFDMTILEGMLRRAKSITPETGFLLTQDNKRTTWQATHDGTGDLFIWEHPMEGLRYLVCLDPATDASQTIGADPDRHSLSVWRDGYHDTYTDRWKPARKVARLRPPFYGEGDEVAGAMVRLSRYYGTCMTVMEMNCGLGILERVQLEGIPCHKRRPLSHRTGVIVEQYGFRMTDKQERDWVIECFAAAIREHAIEVPCVHSVEEYKAFIINSHGKAEAASGFHDDDCFVAGTQILTPDGEVSIETLRVGDLVMTRDGACRIKRLFAKIKPVVSNLGLVGTESHPVITPEGEKAFVSVTDRDTLYIWNSSRQKHEKRSFTEGKNITGTLYRSGDSCVYIFGDMINGRSRLLRYIGNCGLTTTALFLQAISSIIETETRLTTRLKTLKAWTERSTSKCTKIVPSVNRSCGKQAEGRLEESLPPLLNGERSRKLPNSIQRMLKKSFLSLNGKLPALAAELLFYPPTAFLSIARRVAGLGLIIGRLLQRRRVYNLHVEGSHEYFANGILVHNCMADAIAWRTLPSATTYKPQRMGHPNPPDMVPKGSKRVGWREVSNTKQGW